MKNNDQMKESLKPLLSEFAARHLKKARRSVGANKHACPFCWSGTGKSGTSAFSIKEITYSCAKCEERGDIYTLAARLYGLDIRSDFPKVFKHVCEDLGVYMDGNDNCNIKKENTAIVYSKPISIEETSESVKADYTDYINQCVSNLENNDEAKNYLRERGLTEDTINKFRLGYDARCYFPTAQKSLSAIVIPYNRENSYYICRAIEEKHFYKPPSSQSGSEKLFNSEVVDKSEAVFVVEGVFDALSIKQLGFRSIATCGSGRSNVIEYVKTLKGKPTLILVPDRDVAGKEATERIVAELKENNIPFTVDNIPERLGCKDVNEALLQDKNALSKALNQALLLKDIKIKMPDNDALYIEYNFEKDSANFDKHKSIKTGFSELDQRIGGGLHQGLYVLGAATSVGKTAFCHQIACEIAHAKNHVLFFSMEMSKFEMVSRGISRTIGKGEQKKNIVPSSLAVRRGYKNPDIELGAKRFAEHVGTYMNDIQCEFGFSMDDIKKYTESFIARNNSFPVIFIDYLQILSPSNSNQFTRREEIDKMLTSAKLFSNEYKLPVFLVSAINRGNYALPVSLESFKESGGIEYTADVVLGMQLSCFSTETFFENEKKVGEKRKMIQEAINKTPREVEVLILKNRFGTSGGRLQYKYYSNCDLFEEKPSQNMKINNGF